MARSLPRAACIPSSSGTTTSPLLLSHDLTGSSPGAFLREAMHCMHARVLLPPPLSAGALRQSSDSLLTAPHISPHAPLYVLPSLTQAARARPAPKLPLLTPPRRSPRGPTPQRRPPPRGAASSSPGAPGSPRRTRSTAPSRRSSSSSSRSANARSTLPSAMRLRRSSSLRCPPTWT